MDSLLEDAEFGRYDFAHPCRILDAPGYFHCVHGNCALQPLTGKVYTYLNNKIGILSFLSFFAIFELGSGSCGAATSSNMLIVGWVFAEKGGSGLLNGAYTIIHASFPLERQASLNGILIGISQLGLLCGPLVGGFYINLPYAAIVGPLLIFTPLPGHDGKNYEGQMLVSSVKMLDLLGFSIFAGAAIQVLLTLNWRGSSYVWDIIGLFCGSGALLIVFGALEYYMGDGAMIPFSIMSWRLVWASCINYGFFGWTSFLPFMIFAMMTGALVGRSGRILFTLRGSQRSPHNAWNMSYDHTHSTTSTERWGGIQILQGVGRGLGLQILLLAVQSNTRKEGISIVTSLVVFGQNFSGAVFLALAEVIFNACLKSELKTLSPRTSPEIIIAACAAGVRNVVSAKALRNVLLAYSHAIVLVMYLAVAGAGGALLFAFGMGWTSTKNKDTGTEEIGN
ncbi:hypothetical protein PENCOP_c005G06574 [Penicillium coprophilum]|uniref:Major facilitator superfamily (MFS) profile domain-containing protein n=1 Tax=Penicillium coprophilum TaxID=36646 RepID=A0A1V6USF7_9EURO|nr:hypothetical protein PENCOP_c005G06574 [Penicillium coprophilum]